MEEGVNRREFASHYKRGRHHFLLIEDGKIAANGTGKLPIQTMGAFLKKKVVVSMARPQQCG
jgi:hypothetical protein